jgi:hypothetical protein
VEDTEADPQQRLRRMPAEGTLVVEMLVMGPRVRLQVAPVVGPRVRLQVAPVVGPRVRLQEAPVVGPRVRLQEAPVVGPRVRLQDAIHDTVAGPGVRLQEARRTVDTRVHRDAHRVSRAGPHTDFPSRRICRRGRASHESQPPPIRTQSSPNRLRPPASPSTPNRF